MRRQIPEINQLILLLIRLIGRLITSWLSRQAELGLGHVVIRHHKDFKQVSFKQTPLPPDQVPFRQIAAESHKPQRDRCVGLTSSRGQRSLRGARYPALSASGSEQRKQGEGMCSYLSH